MKTGALAIRLKHAIFPVAAVVLLITVWWTGVGGIDFGCHWDEDKIINSVRASVNSGIFVPGWYNYPSVSYDIALFVVFVQTAAWYMLSGAAGLLTPHDPRMAIRIVFLTLSLCSVVWTYLLTRLWGRGRLEASLSAMILLLSWELQYHARWIAPDCIMMQFGALSMLLMLQAMRSREHRQLFLLFAAVAVGLTTGTKYTGGIFIIPLVFSAYLVGRNDRRLAYRNCALVVVMAGVAFLISTPGVILEPTRFVSDLMSEREHYRTGMVHGGDHGGYLVSSSLRHVELMLDYLARVAFSRYEPVALFVFFLSIIGAVSLLRERTMESVWYLVVPAGYLVFLSTQRVMIVRNLIILFPFFAVLAGRGIGCAIEKVPNLWIRSAVVVVLCIGLTLNLGWLYDAMISIKTREMRNRSLDIISFVESNENTVYMLTEKVRGYLQSGDRRELKNAVNSPERASVVVFESSEIQDWGRWVENVAGTYRIVSGSYEVNWDYYASWCGDSRIIAVKKSVARRLGIVGEESQAKKEDSWWQGRFQESTQDAIVQADVADACWRSRSCCASFKCRV